MGREFLEIFEEWAADYDNTVVGNDPQYAKVFENYDAILDEVVRQSSGTVAEFGVGTGNLTNKLMQAGHLVIGIEPSHAMRNIASRKFPTLQLFDGDFLNYPEFPEKVDTIVSTYAFHHLTDDEKVTAIKQFSEILSSGGKIVFGDTMFQKDAEKQLKIDEALKKGFNNLAEDLQREYYPTIDTMRNAFEINQFDVSFKPMNDFVWVLIANKK